MVDNFKIQSCLGVCGSFFMPQVHTPTKKLSFEILKAEHAFEAYCNLYCEMVCHCHYDNSPFADNAFLLPVSAISQFLVVL